MAGSLLAALLTWSLLGGSSGSDSTEPAAATPTTSAPDNASEERDVEGSPDTNGTGNLRGVNEASADGLVWTGDGPLLGGETGLSLLLVYRGDLVTLNLDTAEANIASQTWTGSAFAIVDGHLLSDRQANPQQGYSILALADLGAEPTVLPISAASGPQNDFVELVGVDRDEGIWIVRYGDPFNVELQRVEVSGAADVLESLSLPQSAWPTSASFGLGALIRTRGAVYERTSDGFERLGYGDFKIELSSSVLMGECDDHLRCRSVWRNRHTWIEIESPLNSELDQLLDTNAFVEGLGSDLVAIEHEEGLLVVDARTGVALPFQVGMSRELQRSISVSPDERWVVGLVDQRIVIWDRETETTRHIAQELTTTQQPLFVETSELGR